MARGGPATSVGELLGTLEGKDAQLVLSFIVWPGECPDPRFVDEWVRHELEAKRYLVVHANTSNAAISVPAMSDAPTESNAPSSTQTPVAA